MIDITLSSPRNARRFTIIFRTDASVQIGNGHVMRCLTLAECLARAGCECIFVCAKMSGDLIDAIERRGFEVFSIRGLHNGEGNAETELSHGAWLPHSQEDDARRFLELTNRYQPTWIVVDHYALAKTWEESVRQATKYILVIDDLADREHSCDLLLDQTYARQASDYRSLVPERCKMLVGASHSLLRPEFHSLRKSSLSRRVEPAISEIFVTMGGVDKDNYTGRVLTALSGSTVGKNAFVTVVLGSNSPHIDQTFELLNSLPISGRLLIDVENMAALMLESDLCIGAAGSTSWERCCLAVPTLQITIAPNQTVIAENLRAQGAIKTIESETLEKDLILSLDALSTKDLIAMSQAARQVTDGTGAQLTANEILTSHGDTDESSRFNVA